MDIAAATVVHTGQVVTELFFFAACIVCLLGFFSGWATAPRVWGDRWIYLVLLLVSAALMAWSWP
jgi:hypothetical protein